MGTSASAVVAAVGTTIVIIALGFGGDMMWETSVPKQPAGYQARATITALPRVRVILPASAEAAQPPQQPISSPPELADQGVIQPAKQKSVSAEEPSEKAKVAKRAERKRIARLEERERRSAKARRLAQVRAREQGQQQAKLDAPVMAFGIESPSRLGGGIFGN